MLEHSWEQVGKNCQLGLDVDYAIRSFLSLDFLSLYLISKWPTTHNIGLHFARLPLLAYV